MPLSLCLCLCSLFNFLTASCYVTIIFLKDNIFYNFFLLMIEEVRRTAPKYFLYINRLFPSFFGFPS